MVHTLPVNGSAPAGRKLATTSTTTGAATRPRTISVRSRGKIVPRTCSGQMDNPLYRRAAAVTVAIFPPLLDRRHPHFEGAVVFQPQIYHSESHALRLRREEPACAA